MSHLLSRSRPLILSIAATVGAGCATLDKKLPTGPVVTGAALAPFATTDPSDAAYRGAARVDFPVLPLQVWGVYYRVDLVLVTRASGWDMHEYVLLDDARGGRLWMAKDADSALVQTIVAPLDDLEAYEAEVPVPRIHGAVEVDDRSVGDTVDVTLRYANPAGQQVEVEFWGEMPDEPPDKRNGNTMGHSQQAVAAVLDLERLGRDTRATVTIDGHRVPLARILGLVPERFLLKQAQGGVAVTSFTQTGATDGFTLTRPGPDPVDPATGEPGWPTAATESWSVQREDDGTTAAHVHALGTSRYRFVDGELVGASVRQADREAAVLNMRLDQALPDLRRPFDGVARSRFVLDVNGQIGHGLGTLEAEWIDGDTVEVRFLPEAPRWFAARPMTGQIRYAPDGAVHVEMGRVGAVED